MVGKKWPNIFPKRWFISNLPKSHLKQIQASSTLVQQRQAITFFWRIYSKQSGSSTYLRNLAETTFKAHLWWLIMLAKQQSMPQYDGGPSTSPLLTVGTGRKFTLAAVVFFDRTVIIPRHQSSYSRMMIGMSNHLRNIVFRFHYNS